MNTNDVKILVYILMISILLSGCGPGQFWRPTLTPTFTPNLTSTLTPTSTKTPEPIETTGSENNIELSEQEQIQALMVKMEPIWAEQSGLRDYSETGRTEVRIIEVNGKSVEVVEFRIGQTVISIEKSFVDREINYYDNPVDAFDKFKKKSGETIVPDKTIDNWQYKVALVAMLINAKNLGFGNDVLSYLRFILANQEDSLATSYTLKENTPVPGKPNATQLTGLPPVDAKNIIQIFIANPKVTMKEAEVKKIYGGSKDAPFGAHYSFGNEAWSSLFINYGFLTIMYCQALKSENEIYAHLEQGVSPGIALVAVQAADQSLRSPRVAVPYDIKEANSDFFNAILKIDYKTYQNFPLFVWGK